MKVKLFTYWEGYKPDYIKLCENTISKQICCDIANNLYFGDYFANTVRKITAINGIVLVDTLQEDPGVISAKETKLIS